MSKLPEEVLEEEIHGVLEQWFPGYRDMDTGDGKGTVKRYRIVGPISRNDEGRLYEVRDHADGQNIVGRYSVVVSVERYG